MFAVSTTSNSETSIRGTVKAKRIACRVLRDPARQLSVAFQPVPTLPRATWPEGPVPQQLHLDLTVTTKADLDTQHDRALALGAQLLEDLSDDPEEPLRVYADPAGHPFCIFVAPPPS